MNTYGWYAQKSNCLGDIDLELHKISVIGDGGISKEEIVYLIKVRDKLEIFIAKVNDELSEVSINRLFGVFRRSNVEELEAIFDDSLS